MVRKIELKLIDDELSRQLSFAKRRNGLIKKALELHMVCGLDCLFVSFSPSGRLSCFSGDKRVEDVLARFATVPENLRKFHLSEPELQQLVSILRELKEQTEEHIENDRTIFAVQQEILKVKEEILRAKAELRRFQPLTKAIMTITEANTSEGFLEEALVKVQERKNELSGSHDNNNDASQPSDSVVVVENSSANPSDEVQQSELEHQPNEDSDKNQNQIMPNQSPTFEGQVTPMIESSPLASLVFEMASPNPYQAGTSFTSLLLSADVADETFSPIRETVPVMPQQSNNDYFQQNPFSVFQDGILNTQFYLNNSNTTGGANHNQSSEQNETANSNNINFNLSELTPSGFQIPEAFQMPQQMLVGGSPTTTTSSPLFSSLQWNNQNPTSLGETGGGFQELLNAVAGMNVFPDVRTPAFPNPTNLLMNHQSMGGQTMDLSAPLNVQGSLANSASQAMQGNQISSNPRHFGAGPSSSSAHKRKLPWEDDVFQRLSNNQNGNAASNTAPPAPRPLRNLAYNTAYEIMGLPIDPHFRMLQEMNKNGKGKQQQE